MKNEQKTETFDQLVFKNRNWEYGAYYLRTSYSKNLIKAMVISLTIFLMMITIPILANYLNNKMIVKPPTIIKFELNKLDKPLKDDIEIPKEKDIVKEIEKKVIFRPLVVPAGEITDSNIFIVDDLDSFVNKPLDTLQGIVQKIKEIKVPEVINDQIQDIVSVQEKPEFYGGDKELFTFLSKSTHYPEIAIKYNIQGTVYVSFVVERDGGLSGYQCENKIGGGCDEEAIRVVQSMPKWIPGKQNGNAVRVRVIIPMRFRLVEN